MTNDVLMPKELSMARNIKCRRDDTFRNKRVKRGKLRKQETQIMVGEPNKKEMNFLWD